MAIAEGLQLLLGRFFAGAAGAEIGAGKAMLQLRAHQWQPTELGGIAIHQGARRRQGIQATRGC